jgi:hypothetical protein
MRPLTWLLGEQIAFLSVAQFSIFILEGDAVMAETEFSAFGRGLQPSWTMHYRAAGDVGSKNYSTDYWFSGSYRDYVPDHYRLGYQMARWSYHNFGDGVWNDVARYVSRNPQFIVPMGFGLRRHYGLGEAGLFRRTFADLNAHWASLPRVEDSAERIVTPERGYTTYQWPLWVGGETLVAFKSDLRRTSRIVRVDVESGREKVLTSTGMVSSRPMVDADGVVWWTEFRRSLLWNERVFSRLCSYDLASGRKRVHANDDQVFYPTPLPGGGMAYVAYDRTGAYSIVSGGGRLDLPASVEVTGLAHDDATGGLYFIGLDDGGMFLAAAEGDGFRRLTPSRHITISDLRAGGGRLYFGSIASGKDEAHALDLASGEEYRLSRSAYGAFQPSTPTAGRVALTTYDKHGYHLATQDVVAPAVQEQQHLPLNLVNPQWRRWTLPTMDSLVYDEAAAQRSATERKSRRFSKMLNLLQPHSWLPLDFYPPAAIDENDLTMRLGATIISQSLLSDATTWLSYGWTREGGSMMRGGLSYRGLGPVLDVDFTWGGAPQILHTRAPESVVANRHSHLAITTRLSLPMSVSSGAWLGTVTPSVEYNYYNGLIFEPPTGASTDMGTLTHGVERLSLNLGYAGQTRMAHSEFLPRWGVAARIGHIFNPTNSDFRSIWSGSISGWLPGVVRPHSVRVRAALQLTDGRSDATFGFRMKDVFPRGALYNFSTQRWWSSSLDYQLPVWYPEGGIPGVLYFKRIRLNVFGDYAQWMDFGRTANNRFSPPAWHELYSYGGDLILDLSPLRLPATNTVTATFTFAKPSDQSGVFFNFGLTIPL